MRKLVLRIIVIERCSAGGCPLEEASEHCFLSIKVSFWCCGSLHFVVPLVFCYIFVFLIIDLVPNKWYQSTFLCGNCGNFFSRVETCTVTSLKHKDLSLQQGKTAVGKTTCRKYKRFHRVTRNKCFTLLETSVTPVGTPLSSTTSDKICT
jgi:hypothetical protein